MGIRAHAEQTDAWLDYRAVLVTLACVLGAVYSSYLLYRNFQDVGARTGTPMAKLERIEAKVRLKPAQSFIWSQVKANEQLYRKDSIQTAPRGGATVQFNDGTVLEVGENSLIIIDSLENLSLGFLRGSAVLRTSTGDSRITLDKDGKTRIEALPIRMIAPEALSHYFTEGTKPVAIQFNWELQPKAGQPVPDGLSIQISADRGFRGGVHEVKIAAGASDASTALLPGTYYWRVLTHGQPLGEPVQFDVDGVSGLKPLFPEASDKVPIFGGDASVQFRWVPETQADDEDFKASHVLEIASDPSFRDLQISQPIAASAGSSMIADAKGAFGGGAHYWRIVSQYQSPHSHLTIHSPTESFKIDKIANVSIDLGAPADNEAVRLGGGVHFSWHSDVESVGYRWQLRSAGTAAQPGDSVQTPIQSPIQSIDTSSAKSYSWASERAGRYQWRVEAVYQEKVVGESQWRTFLASTELPIALRAPVEGKEIHFWTDPTRFDFSWGADPKAQGYLVEVASDATFKDAATARTSSTELASQAIQLKSGPQVWRVSALDASGRVINSSASRKLDYGVFPPLRAPASAKPAAGAIVNPLEMEQDPSITWTPVTDAQSYEVTIKQGNRVVSRQVVKDTKSAMKGLQAGDYAYTIRAIDKLQRKGEPLSERKFAITYGQPLGAPEALSPEVQ